MTNNDKAIDAALTEDEIKSSFIEFINWVKPNTGLSPSTVGTIQKMFKEALTPQSSADLGRVKALLEGIAKRPDLPNPDRDADWKNCQKWSSHDAKEALRLLDEVGGV